VPVSLKVGRGHEWHYDQGEWKEKKSKPDEWEFIMPLSSGGQGMLRKGAECGSCQIALACEAAQACVRTSL